MRYQNFLTTSLLSVALAGCGSLIEFAGKVAGTEVGRRVATAPPAKVIVQPKGGSFCTVMGAMGGPFAVVTTDARTTQNLVVSIDEHGAKHCGWK